MKAIMYGAGNIGRGFIGKRFSLSGWDVTFVDINEAVVNQLQKDGGYPVYVTRGNEYVKEWVGNCTGFNGKDVDGVIKLIAECDILATSLGVNVLPFVAENLAKGIAARYAAGGEPLNILICENLIGSEKILRGYVRPYITEDLVTYFEEQIGFVSCCVGITVPPTPKKFTDENPLAVCTDYYNELPADLTAFRPVGAPTPDMNGLVPFTPFDFYIERKLMLHNMGHATMAYLGYQKGLSYIYEVGRDPEIKYILLRALDESARGLAKRHGADLDGLLSFIDNLIPRLDNPLLEDTLLRVGKDTKRKLSPSDRLVGAFNCVKESGKTPAYLAVGIAAGLLWDCEGDEAGAEVSACAKNEGVAAALAKYSQITDKADVALIKRFYDMLAAKASFAELIAALNEYAE